jgi:hypothetical protein
MVWVFWIEADRLRDGGFRLGEAVAVAEDAGQDKVSEG